MIITDFLQDQIKIPASKKVLDEAAVLKDLCLKKGIHFNSKQIDAGISIDLVYNRSNIKVKLLNCVCDNLKYCNYINVSIDSLHPIRVDDLNILNSLFKDIWNIDLER